jgi:hypothetical protein
MKTVYDGAWVKVRNGMNSHFNAFAPCEKCKRFAMESVWYNIYDKRVYCLKCYVPKR